MKALFLLLAAGCLASPALADQQVYGAAATSSAWLGMPVSAREAGMGQAQAAVAGSVDGLDGNPAGLAGLNGQQAVLMHDALLQDLSMEHLAYGLSLGGGRGLAVGLQYMDYGAIDRYQDNGGRLQSTGTLHPYGLNGGIGYGQALGSLSAGATLKVVSEALDGASSASTVAGDLGLQWRAGAGFSLGVAVQDLGGRINGADLPLNTVAGLAYQAPLGGGGRILLALDGALPAADASANSLRLGAEYSGGMYALRAGYESTANDGTSGFTVGAGLKFASFGLDYAFADRGVLGSSNQFSLNVDWAPAPAPAAVVAPAPAPTPAPAAAAPAAPKKKAKAVKP